MLKMSRIWGLKKQSADVYFPHILGYFQGRKKGGTNWSCRLLFLKK